VLSYDSGVIGGGGLDRISEIVVDYLNFVSAVVSWRGVEIGGGRLNDRLTGRPFGRRTEFLRGAPCSDSTSRAPVPDIQIFRQVEFFLWGVTLF